MLKLYTSQVCPFAHRCRLALALTGLPHERVEIDLKSMPDWYRDVSPNQKVPLLEHEGQKIWESAVINEYLADAFPDKASLLQPATPLLRAQSRLAIDWAGNHIIPTFYQVLRQQPEDANSRLAASLQESVRWMTPEGPFWLGSQPCLADLAIYPWFERWNVLSHYRDIQMEMPARLSGWIEAMASLPFVKNEAGDPDSFIRGYARYATPAPVA